MDRNKMQRMVEDKLMVFNQIKWCDGEYSGESELHKLEDNIYYTYNFIFDNTNLGFVSTVSELFILEDNNYKKVGEFRIKAKPIVDRLLNEELNRAIEDKVEAKIEVYRGFLKVNNFLIF